MKTMCQACGVVFLSIMLLLVSGCAHKQQVTDDITQVTFDVEYHRGGRRDRPENTLYSYLFAIEEGATTIECDMQLIEDDVIVLSHDPFLHSYIVRDENGDYVSDTPVLDMRTMTLDELRKYDVAKVDPSSDYYETNAKNQKTPEHAQIPTLDELFSLIKEYGNGILVNIEMKIYHDVEADPQACIETDPVKFSRLFNEKVLEYNLTDQVILQSFDWQALVEMKKINPDIRVSALWSEQPAWGRSDEYLRLYEDGASPYLAGLDIDDFQGDAVKAAHSLGFDIVSPYCRELTMEQVAEAHAYGMKVIPWNANTRSEIEAMLAMGVDGIISDDAGLLRTMALEQGKVLLKQRKISDSEYHLQ